MITSQDVADFYIDVFRNSADPMTPRRLSRFLYFAQGWSLVRFGKPLFDQSFKAFSNGPALTAPQLPKTDTRPLRRSIGKHALEAFTPEQLELLLDVAGKYSRFGTGELSRIACKKGGAWAGSYAEYPAELPTIPLGYIRIEFERVRTEEGDLPDFFLKESERFESEMTSEDGDSELPPDA